MARLNCRFTVENTASGSYHVICVKKDTMDKILHSELRDLAARYSFVGKEGKHFLKQSQDLAELVLGCANNPLKTGFQIYQLTKIFPADAEISVILKDFSDSEIKDVVTGIKLQAYEFLQYKTIKEEDYKERKNTFRIVTDQLVKNDIEIYDKVIEGVMFMRDLANEPPNVIYPENLASRIRDNFKGTNVTVKVLDVDEMTKLNMGGILAVGQGSRRPPRMIVLEYNGGTPGDAPLAFVGKAVTFDTGGISIKPSAHMEDMKYDMCGGATVAGLLHALSSRKAKINAIGVIGAAENMPDGNAYRPSDIVTTASGKTIEVLNTDAEGRVVLADALWYASNYKPKFIIDLATLTGAMTVALGQVYAGIFTESDVLAQSLIDSGILTGEPLWRMPLHKQFTKNIKSKIADVRNTSAGKGAGSSTAAAFLREFVPKEIDWCHIDIASVADEIVSEHLSKEGASGFGVRLLDAFVRKYEK